MFDDVQNPPRITLSVSRGMDDNKYNDLERLSKLDRHHKHWRDVIDAEIGHKRNSFREPCISAKTPWEAVCMLARPLNDK